MEICHSTLSEIVLTKEEQRLLSRFSSGQLVHLPREEAHKIRRFDFIHEHIVWTKNGEQLPWDGTYQLSDFGEHFLAYKRENTLSFVRRSVLVPIVVAFLTTILTNNLWPIMWRWLTTMLQGIR